MGSHHGFASWVRIVGLHHGFASWVRIVGSQDEREPSGTTASTLTVMADHYVIANLGDSRLALARGDGVAAFASRDHKPMDELEKARVEASGM